MVCPKNGNGQRDAVNRLPPIPWDLDAGIFPAMERPGGERFCLKFLRRKKSGVAEAKKSGVAEATPPSF